MRCPYDQDSTLLTSCFSAMDFNFFFGCGVCKNLPVRSVMTLHAHVAPRVQLGRWVHERRVGTVAATQTAAIVVCTTAVTVVTAVVVKGTVWREEDARFLAGHDTVRERIVVTLIVVPELADITFEAYAELNPSRLRGKS